MTFREISVRSVLSRTGIPGKKYCINPYVGCAHSCRYCYAVFMKRYTGHAEPWGRFVDIKINAPDVLRRELRHTQRGDIILGSVTDAYQPVETRYRLTRRCLEVLATYQFPLDILTKSPLVLRDIDIISRLEDVRVGITITTDDEQIREIFEPNAPLISDRMDALKRLHEAGIRTYAFIGPILPMRPELLTERIRPYVQRVIIDCMNYAYRVEWLYRRHSMMEWLDTTFINRIIARLRHGLSDKEVTVC